jgi:tRNA(Ile)-lysidine synthase
VTPRTDPAEILDGALRNLPDGPLLLLFSGGLDSSALLHALVHSIEARRRGLSALHVDHALHPDSALWAEHCARIADAWAVPIRVARVHVPHRSGQGLEAAARHARYAAATASLAPGAIALAAHHADDQAETVVLRLVRGAGLSSLGGMRPLRALGPGHLARPWLGVARAAIRAYAERHRLEWLEDPSNTILHHDRNWLRAEIMPALRARWPEVTQGIVASAGLLRAASAPLERAVAEAGAACLGPGHTLRIQALSALDGFLLAEVVRAWLARLELPPPNARVLARVRPELLEARPDATPRLAWRGAVVRRYRDLLHASAPVPVPDPGWEHAWDGLTPLALPSGLGQLALVPARPVALRVSLRRGGERIVVGAGRPSQSVKHLLQEMGVPPWQRARLPLLWHGDALWAVGDALRAGAFDAWLSEHGTRYLWQRFALTEAGP